MNTLIKLLGSITLAIFMYAIPCLTVISWYQHWAPFFRFLFIVASILEIMLVVCIIYDYKTEY